MAWSVLALDQSPTNTGWAHLAEGQRTPTWGKFVLPSWENAEGERLYEFYEWLGHKVVDLNVTHLIAESMFTPGDHAQSDTAQIGRWGLIGICDMVRYVCNAKRGMDVDFSMVSSASWRKAFLGAAMPPKGLVKHQRRAWLKEKSIAACHARGWLVESDDTADALGILAYACAAIDPAFMAKQGALFRKAEAQVEDEERSLR